jgi:hypothetical protein
MSKTLTLVWDSFDIQLAVFNFGISSTQTCFCLTVAHALKIVTADSPRVSIALLSKFKEICVTQHLDVSKLTIICLMQFCTTKHPQSK